MAKSRRSPVWFGFIALALCSGCSSVQPRAVSVPAVAPTPAVVPPVTVPIHGVVQTQDFTYTTNNDTITITKYTGSDAAVSIPGTINGLPVTSIGMRAFEGSRLNSVNLPDSVTSIGTCAFQLCLSLTNIVIPSSVTNIGDCAFRRCDRMTGVYFRGDAPRLGVKGLGGGRRVVCYQPGTTGWPTIFGGCPTSVWNPLGQSNADVGVQRRSVPAAAPAQDFTYTTNNGTITITRYTGSGGVVSMPKTLEGLPVARIGAGAFQGCWNPTSVTIPDGVTSIGDYAFAGSIRLKSVLIGPSVTNIGAGAFNYCYDLTGIAVDTNNPAYSGVDGVLFDKSQTTLIRCPNPRAETYTIPEGVTTIGDYAFSGCSRLTGVTIPDGVTNIGDGAFTKCSSLIVYFKGTAPTLGVGVFDRNREHHTATIYYLPGTTGWGKEFGGRPTAVWNLPARTNAASGVQAK